jgi:WD40 repeat protein
VIRSTPLTDVAFTSLDVSQDGKMVAGVDEANRILIYYATTGTRKIVIEAEQVYRITMILFSPDGSQIASLSGGYLAELYVYDTETGNKVHSLSGYNTMTYAPDGKTLVSDNIDYGIYVWDAVNGKKLVSPAADWIYDVAFSPDGKTIAIAGVEVHQMKKDRQNVISFFDPSTYQMQPQKFNGQPAVLSKLRYSPDGTMLASVDAHGNVRIWNAVTGEVVKEIRESVPGPVQLAFMANGRTLILGGGDGTLRFYEVK